MPHSSKRVDDHLGVGVVGAEDVAEPLELGPDLRVVVDLAVEDDADGAVLVRHRLHRRLGEVDDREPPEAEPDAAVVGDPGRGAVGAAVRDRVAHARDERRRSTRNAARVEARACRRCRTSTSRRPTRAPVRKLHDHVGRALAGVSVPERDRLRGTRRRKQRRNRRRCAPARDRAACSCRARRVTGRSVVSRSVKHGTPSADVSSCTPPESVSTTRASASSPRNSR